MSTNLNMQNYFNNKEDSSYLMYSSKNLHKKTFNPNFADATSLKKDVQRKRFTEEDYPQLPTQKKLNFTPFRKDENQEDFKNFESKQTIQNFSLNIFNQNKALTNNFNYFDSNDKENSSIHSNSRSNVSMFNSSEIKRNPFSSESGFKIPTNKGLITEDQEKKNYFNQVKKNLQFSFTNKDSKFLFDSNNRQYKATTIISSSSSSSSQLDLKEDFGTNSEIMDQVHSNFNPIPRNPFLPAESQKTITDDDNFKRSSLFLRNYSNDEKYKLLAIKKIRKHTFKDNKSTSHNDFSAESNFMLDCAIFTNKRKKLAHSVKKLYSSEILLTDPLTNIKHSFKIFQDIDIGFNLHWQQYLKNSQGDEDVPSDEEQINRAEKHNYEEFGAAIAEIFVNKKTNLIHNLEMRKENV